MTPEILTPQLIGIGVPTLRQLRAGLLSAGAAGDEAADDAVRLLREAGHAGGDAVYEAFQLWLSGTAADPSVAGDETAVSSTGVADMTLPEFGEHASRFFRDAGWGEMTFAGREEDGVAEVEIAECWESAGGGGGTMPGCHVTTGMLAAFFGRVAGYPVAVLEAECRGSGGDRCCFAMGNADVMNHEWERLK